MLVPIPITDEQARMGQEAAKTVRTFLDLLVSVGRGLANSQLATIAGDAVGHWLRADNLHQDRLNNIEMLKVNGDAKIKHIKQDRISEPSPSVVLPLLEAAMDESREQLQDLWASLLANCMIDGGSKVRRDFFVTRKALEPIDAVILELFNIPAVARPRVDSDQAAAMSAALKDRKISGVSNDTLFVSLQALGDCRCIRRPDGTLLWGLTAYGRAFLAACRVE